MKDKFDIIFLYTCSWDDFKALGFHNRSGNVFSILAEHPQVNKLMYVYISNFFLYPEDRNNAVKNNKPYYFTQLTQIDEHIFVLNCKKLLPFSRFGWIEAINDKILAKIIKDKADSLEIDSSVVWFYKPLLTGLACRIKKGKIVYDSTETLLGDIRYKGIQAKIKQDYHQLAKKADLIFTVGEDMKSVFEEFAGKSLSNVYWIPNGVNLDYFNGSIKIPEVFNSIPRPIIGYIGTLNHNTNFDLLKFIAQSHPDWSLVIVGSYAPGFDDGSLKKLPNVYHLGFQPPESLPTYLHAFDVCLGVYKQGSEVVETGDSIKIYYYLASGKPVVSTNVQRVDRFKEVVEIADTKEEFKAHIEKSLINDNKDLQKKRREIVHSQTWDQRVNLMMEHIGKWYE